MCEQFVARAAEPFRIDELWPFTERLERYGLAGFGWGAAWTRGDGRLCSHRDLRAFREDAEGAGSVGREKTTAVLIHLRRPSRLSTLQLPDAQPFDDPAGRYAFSHNGDLREWRDAPRPVPARGTDTRSRRHRGRRSVARGPLGRRAAAALKALHDEFHGQANLAVLTADGTPVHYADNTDNPVFTFRLGRIRLGEHGPVFARSLLVRFAAPGATARRLVRQGDAVRLERNGDPLRAS